MQLLFFYRAWKRESRFCSKAAEIKNLKLVNPISSKSEILEKRLSCNRCKQKFNSVNDRKVHEARYCGKLKFRMTKKFSNSVKNASGTEREIVRQFGRAGFKRI